MLLGKARGFLLRDVRGSDRDRRARRRYPTSASWSRHRECRGPGRRGSPRSNRYSVRNVPGGDGQRHLHPSLLDVSAGPMLGGALGFSTFFQVRRAAVEPCRVEFHARGTPARASSKKFLCLGPSAGLGPWYSMKPPKVIPSRPRSRVQVRWLQRASPRRRALRPVSHSTRPRARRKPPAACGNHAITTELSGGRRGHVWVPLGACSAPSRAIFRSPSGVAIGCRRCRIRHHRRPRRLSGR